MTNQLYAYQHYLLRSIAAQLHIPSLVEIAKQPGIRAVYRVTYHDVHEKHHDSIATLTGSLTNPPTLQISYLVTPRIQTNTAIDQTHYDAFVKAFSAFRFDNLEDEPDIPPHRTNLMLVERGAGSFQKSVLMVADTAQEPYSTLTGIFNTYFPEMTQKQRSNL